jgi:adenylosuccinate synthase
MSLWIVVGGQYGSEGKGKVSAFITRQEDIDICVRCGGPNSGHSFVDDSGFNVVVRQLPTGFINPRTRLLIPAGALIDPSIVKQEIESLGLTPNRVGIDHKCFVIDERDREEERRLLLSERLSSTLCGVGAALARRVLRSQDAKFPQDVAREHPWLNRYLTDVSDEVNTALDLEKKVLIEGTQGFGLSLYHSDCYPHTTSRDTTASGFLSEVGVSPRLVTEIVVVVRTFPIRVAGMQAGPMKQETTWEQIQKESGYPRPVEEHTSVTRKLRRVARFDWDLVKKALVVNRATRVAINGLDLLNYNNFAVTTSQSLDRSSTELSRKVAQFAGCHLLYLGTGPSLRHLFLENLSLSEDSVCYSGMQSGSKR